MIGWSVILILWVFVLVAVYACVTSYPRVLLLLTEG